MKDISLPKTLKVEIGVVEQNVKTGRYLRGKIVTTSDINRAIFDAVKPEDITKEFFAAFNSRRTVKHIIHKKEVEITYKNILVRKTYEQISL